MTNKRNLFAELTEGFEALTAERAGKHRAAGDEEALAPVMDRGEDAQRREIARAEALAQGGDFTVSHGDSGMRDLR